MQTQKFPMNSTNVSAVKTRQKPSRRVENIRAQMYRELDAASKKPSRPTK